MGSEWGSTGWPSTGQWGGPTWQRDWFVLTIGCCLARPLLPSLSHFYVWCLWLLSKLDSHQGVTLPFQAWKPLCFSLDLPFLTQAEGTWESC